MSNLYHPAQQQQQQQQSLDVSFPLHIQQDLFTSETFPNLGMSFNASFPFLHSSIPQQQQQQHQQQYAIDSPSNTHESQFLDVSDLLAFQNSNNTITPTAPELFDLQNDLALFSTSPDLGLTLHPHHFQQQLLLSSPSQTPSHRLLGTSLINLATTANSISPTDLYPEPSSMSQQQQQQQQQTSGTTEFESSFELLAGPSSSSTTDTLRQPPLASSSSSSSSSRRPFTFPKCPPPPSSQPGSRPGSRAGSRASSPTLTTTTKEYKRVRVPRDQMEWLKQIYDVNPYPSQEELETISQDLGIGVRKVRVWFQNRRTRQKALIMDRK
ncbi:hypothetical protein CcCBS67573_g10286 [Chytriomyces confervae]|uniref:Homeobox domain-containing protein n=1 Tax=Chytriomyces confervae TaxID=246404 RepID=A0A507D6A9_9FUNG|nr:hypothetical protein CcCBS67573_g10286 [Chytriomyces confervae]